jgi:hypothetical protein
MVSSVTAPFSCGSPGKAWVPVPIVTALATVGGRRLTHLAKGLRIVSSHFAEGERHGLEAQRKLHRDPIADTPKVMTGGNWKLGVFVDEEATDEQADKLVRVFTGQLGGRMAGIAPLVGEVLRIEKAAFDVRDDGVRHSVRVGDVIDFEIEDIVSFGVETAEPVKFSGMFHPVASDFTIAEATRSRINAFGIEYEGKTGLSTSQFSWAA